MTIEEIIMKQKVKEILKLTQKLCAFLFRANSLHKIDKAAKAEDSENRENIYQDLAYRVYVKGEDISKLLEQTDSDIYKLEGTQIGSLLSVSKAERQSFINEEYSKAFGTLSDWSNLIGTPSEANIEDNYNKIYDLYKTGDLSLDKFISARNGYVLYLEEKFVNPNARAAGISLFREIWTTVHIVFLLRLDNDA